MSLGEKFKENVVDSSDSYNFYKDGYENLSKEMASLLKKNNEELENLKKDIDNLKKSQEDNDEILNSYYVLFSNLYLDYELKPKGMLRNTQYLCQELLDFVDKVCQKHDLKYWLDFGNLLGAARHQNFIPWDDDLDIGMMREDSIKFLEVIDEELNIHGLEGIVKISEERFIGKSKVVAFTQISVLDAGSKSGIFAGLDIFPCDYIINPSENIEEEFLKARKNFHTNILEGLERKEVYEKFYDELNLSFQKQDHFIPSVEIYGDLFNFKLFETDKLFPLSEIEFNGKSYPCPNDYKYHLEKIYGNDYMEIPKVVRRHKRVNKLKQLPDAEEKYEKYFKLFKEANENFKY